ncbi:rve domain-containing protein/RVT_3 domain-containing protein [Gossypium australe]|uniref:Rve domain-containing protein/RVT_3 domain-containing protein n=1 Tax=Gossypium australe TaxID=47621 RepID=A0A5B6WFX5_9ROSI|nr:rve domain-containing protein/RVT_3 domain-containing protein [Gossypium australe]
MPYVPTTTDTTSHGGDFVCLLGNLGRDSCSCFNFPIIRLAKCCNTWIKAHKLRPYFQAHPVIIMMNQPVKDILSKANTSERITKWGIELAEFDVKYALRTTIKG